MSETIPENKRKLDQELASFVADLSFEEIPDEAVRSAERAFVDTVGVTLAGAAEGAGSTAIDAFAAMVGNCGDTDVLGTDRQLPVTDAVFVNATAGHGLDFDDVTWGVWHPSVPIVAPALSAAADADASGKRAIEGYVAGYETQVYLASALLPAHYEKGWHATATFGTFGAAAAVATVLNLDEEQTRHAMNIAASMPAGLKHNFGSMTKPMHAGQAARSGYTAAMLAAEGFTGADTAVGGDRGFCDLYSGGEGPTFDELPQLGDRWGLVKDGIEVKKYPCCYFTHPSIAAALDIREEQDLAAEDIMSVHVTTSQGAADALHYENPKTGLEGKFSMHYPVAVALAKGEVTLTTFDDENIDDDAVQLVRQTVTFEVDSELPYDPFMTTVVVETTDGETYTRQREEPPGTPSDPLSDDELREKFEMCANRAPSNIDAQAAYEVLDSLRDHDPTELFAFV